MNKLKIEKSFGRSLDTYDEQATVQNQIAETLSEKLIRRVPKKNQRILEIGCGTGMLTKRLRRYYSDGEYIANDICPGVFRHLPADVTFSPGDAETIHFPGVVDIIASSSSIQWFADPILFIQNAAHILSENGVIAIAVFGDKNLYQLRNVTGNQGLNYPSLKIWEKELSRSYEILDIEEEKQTRWFSSLTEIFRHLRDTGVNGISSTPKTRMQINLMAEQYKSMYEEEGLVPLTYHPFYIVARKK